MTLRRRQFLSLATAAAALPIIPRLATAQEFPTRPVRIIVGFPPGGVGDISARLLAQAMQERLGQPIIVENRPGAGGSVGTEAVVRSPADGYMLVWAGANNAINGALYGTLSYDFVRDITGVASFMGGPLVLLVNPALPARTVPEFIAYAKANPGKINMGSSGNGTILHLTSELFKMMADVNTVHVPYRGDNPALTDLLSGQLQGMFANIPSAIEQVRAGKLRALAVTSATPWPALPDVPPVAAAVPGFEVRGWFGLGAPRATPREAIAKLNAAANDSLSDPKVLARIEQFGSAPMRMTPDEFDKFVAAETDKWTRVIKFSGAKVN